MAESFEKKALELWESVAKLEEEKYDLEERLQKEEDVSGPTDIERIFCTRVTVHNFFIHIFIENNLLSFDMMITAKTYKFCLISMVKKLLRFITKWDNCAQCKHFPLF